MAVVEEALGWGGPSPTSPEGGSRDHQAAQGWQGVPYSFRRGTDPLPSLCCGGRLPGKGKHSQTGCPPEDTALGPTSHLC